MKWIPVVLLVAAPALAAQEPADSARAERLRAEIEQRFAERVKADLGLSDEQASRLRTAQQRFGERRRTLARQQMEVRRALQLQMRPGVQANADSVRKLLDAQRQGRELLMRLEAEEDRELAGFLTPVQRAQLQMMRLHVAERIRDVRRGGRGGGGRPGVRPRPDGRRPGRRPA